MKRNELENFLDDHENSYLQFHEVRIKKSSRPDLHAFLILNELFPDEKNILFAAEHDEVRLNVNMDEFCKRTTKEIVLDLHRCGILYDKLNDFLFMYV